MAKKPAQNQISSRIHLNLLFPMGLPQHYGVKFVKWLVNYGRYILVVVEIIVMGAFVYRFFLDATLDQLKDQIIRRVNTIQSLSTDEALLRQTQLQISTIKNIYIAAPKFAQIIEQISAQVPEGVTLNSINLDKVENSPFIQFKVIATAKTNSDVAAFLYGLKSENAPFQGVNLTSITFEQGIINFSLTGSTK